MEWIADRRIEETKDSMDERGKRESVGYFLGKEIWEILKHKE